MHVCKAYPGSSKVNKVCRFIKKLTNNASLHCWNGLFFNPLLFPYQCHEITHPLGTSGSDIVLTCLKKLLPWKHKATSIVFSQKNQVDILIMIIIYIFFRLLRKHKHTKSVWLNKNQYFKTCLDGFRVECMHAGLWFDEVNVLIKTPHWIAKSCNGLIFN